MATERPGIEDELQEIAEPVHEIEQEEADLKQQNNILEHPVNKAVEIDNSNVVLDPVQPIVQIAEQFGASHALLHAYHAWLQGVGDFSLPISLLDKISIDEVIATPKPWLQLFVGMNLCVHRRFEAAARCHVASFTNYYMQDIDECQYMDELIKEATGMSLENLCAESRERALREVACVLERWQNERERLLKKAKETEANRKIRTPVCWEDAAAVLMGNCSALYLQPAQIHLLLVYAEGLCIRHFEQRLFSDRIQLVGKDDALEYAGVDMAAAVHRARDVASGFVINPPFSRECARLLAAVSAIAGEVAKQNMQDLLDDEPLWLASSPDEPVATNTMMYAFRKCASQSTMFNRAEQFFEHSEEVESASVCGTAGETLEAVTT